MLSPTKLEKSINLWIHTNAPKQDGAAWGVQKRRLTFLNQISQEYAIFMQK
jgi:hypothetical protein